MYIIRSHFLRPCPHRWSFFLTLPYRLINEHLPAIIAARDRGEICVENIDVFCEKGVYEMEDSCRILEAGKLVA